MNYDLWLTNKLTKIRNLNKYEALKRYIKNIKEATGKEQQKNRILNMMLASTCFDISHNTNASKILELYLRRHGYEW